MEDDEFVGSSLMDDEPMASQASVNAQMSQSSMIAPTTSNNFMPGGQR